MAEPDAPGRFVGPFVAQLPPTPAPSATTGLVVYNKATGEAFSCAYAVDARELVASGEFQAEPPAKNERAAAAEATEATAVASSLNAVAPQPGAPLTSPAALPPAFQKPTRRNARRK